MGRVLMYRVIVIGEREKILPFRVLGMGLEYVGSGEELGAALERVVQTPDVCLIIVSEDMVVERPGIIAAFRDRTHVPILVLPSHLGSARTSIMETSRKVKRAIGVDIIEEGRD